MTASNDLINKILKVSTEELEMFNNLSTNKPTLARNIS